MSRNVDFYSAYEIMSQMVALYGVAFRAQDAAATLQSLVSNMGTVFQLVEAAKDDQKGATVTSDASAIDLLERLRRLQPRLNPWTGRRRWLRVLKACEMRWQMALEEMSKTAACADECATLAADSRERVAFLVERDASVRDLRRRRNDSYAVPVPL